MADVFVSYAREESGRADEVRHALEALGLTVFFDVERLDAGDEWSDVLDRELKAAGAVVALWSPHALSRPWVRKECASAQARGVLLPALLEPVSDLDMPVQFAGLQRVDLSDYHGQGDHAGWRKLVRALAKTLKRNDLLAAQIEALKEEKQTTNVKAELEAAQRELGKLRKSKGGVRPAFVAAGIAVLLGLGGAGAWWAIDHTRASLADANVLELLAAIPDDRIASADVEDLVDEVFGKVSLPQLIEASKIDGDAALLAGWAYELGERGVLIDHVEATRFFERSCRLGSPRGCNALGRSHEEGSGVPKDAKRAAAFFDQACKSKVPRACANLAYMYETGAGVPENDAEAAALNGKACDGGDMRGCYYLGVSYANGAGVAKDQALAVTLFEKSCDGGDPAGCASLGVMHEMGRGVQSDRSKAFAYYTKSCDSRDAAGCVYLGSMYERGLGVEGDRKRAQDLYNSACSDRVVLGCASLARLHERADAATPADLKEAVSAYSIGCRGGDAISCTALGDAYFNGRGIEMDFEAAKGLYAKACDAGQSDACQKADDMIRYPSGSEQKRRLELKDFEEKCVVANICHD